MSVDIRRFLTAFTCCVAAPAVALIAAASASADPSLPIPPPPPNPAPIENAAGPVPDPGAHGIRGPLGAASEPRCPGAYRLVPTGNRANVTPG